MRSLHRRVEGIESKVSKVVEDSRPVIWLEDLTDEQLDKAIEQIDKGIDPFPGYQLLSRNPKLDAGLAEMTDAELDAELQHLDNM